MPTRLTPETFDVATDLYFVNVVKQQSRGSEEFLHRRPHDLRPLEVYEVRGSRHLDQRCRLAAFIARRCTLSSRALKIRP